jgi:hypothetical protein
MKGGHMAVLFTPDHNGTPVELDMEDVYDQMRSDEYYCVDGCEIEPDGRCPYGLLSGPAVAGLI